MTVARAGKVFWGGTVRHRPGSLTDIGEIGSGQLHFFRDFFAGPVSGRDISGAYSLP
jgi:hypothetical protein